MAARTHWHAPHAPLNIPRFDPAGSPESELFSARCLRSERELKPPRGIIYPISRLLIVRIDVREPTDATSHDILQKGALLIKKVVIAL